jgi:hypothetical protein
MLLHESGPRNGIAHQVGNDHPEGHRNDQTSEMPEVKSIEGEEKKQVDKYEDPPTHRLKEPILGYLPDQSCHITIFPLFKSNSIPNNIPSFCINGKYLIATGRDTVTKHDFFLLKAVILHQPQD